MSRCQVAIVQTKSGRRVRDAIKNALSEIVLLGIEEQVQPAARAAAELAANRPVRAQALVVLLCNLVRRALDSTRSLSIRRSQAKVRLPYRRRALRQQKRKQRRREFYPDISRPHSLCLIRSCDDVKSLGI